MQERRRHQRVRCTHLPPFSIWAACGLGQGSLENLSISGVMLRTDLALRVGQPVGLAVGGLRGHAFETVASVVSRVGDLIGLRFRNAPLAMPHIEAIISDLLQRGEASAATLHDLGGQKTLRVCGGFTPAIDAELRHFVERVANGQLDVGEVTAVDPTTLAHCLPALLTGQIKLAAASPVFLKAYQEAT